jgi:hypothetical protein
MVSLQQQLFKVATKSKPVCFFTAPLSTEFKQLLKHRKFEQFMKKVKVKP